MKRFVVTANRLLDGRVVYLGARNEWVEQLRRAVQTENEEQRDALLAQARTDEKAVCGAYTFTVERGATGDDVVPSSAREQLRAAGPEAVRARFGYESGQTDSATEPDRPSDAPHDKQGAP